MHTMFFIAVSSCCRSSQRACTCRAEEWRMLAETARRRKHGRHKCFTQATTRGTSPKLARNHAFFICREQNRAIALRRICPGAYSSLRGETVCKRWEDEIPMETL